MQHGGRGVLIRVFRPRHSFRFHTRHQCHGGVQQPIDLQGALIRFLQPASAPAPRREPRSEVRRDLRLPDGNFRQRDEFIRQFPRELFHVFQAVAHQHPSPCVMPAPARIQFALHPLVPLVIEMLVESCTVVFLERRIDTGFHGIEPQEMPCKTVDRFNVGPFHLTHRLVAHRCQLLVGEAGGFLNRPDRLDFVPVGLLLFLDAHGQILHEPQPVAHPQFQFTGRLVGKGDGHDLRQRQRLAAPGQQVEDAIDEQGGLARARSRRHDDVGP